MLFYHVAAHILAEGFGYGNGTILVLIVFEDGGNGTADGYARAVKGMNKLCVILGGLLKADGAAASLIILEVGAGGNLDVASVGGHPDLNIVGLGGRDVSRALIKEMFDKLFNMVNGGEEEEVQFLGLRW